MKYTVISFLLFIINNTASMESWVHPNPVQGKRVQKSVQESIRQGKSKRYIPPLQVLVVKTIEKHNIPLEGHYKDIYNTIVSEKCSDIPFYLKQDLIKEKFAVAREKNSMLPKNQQMRVRKKAIIDAFNTWHYLEKKEEK